MAITIAVVDGMGGGIGALLVERLKAALGEGATILALGTNSAATERMLKAGADRGASGENAIRVTVAQVDLIMGPIGIIIPNGLMGEIGPAAAQAVSEARGKRILLPVQQPHFSLAGLEPKPLAQLAALTVDMAIKEAERLS
jgi:hypothetical protein